MNIKIIHKIAQSVCDNYNQANTGYTLEIIKDAKTLAEFYKTYNGPVEFLYIAPEEEIKEAIGSGAIFLGIKENDVLAGVEKVAPLKLPYPFFVPPKSLKNKNNFWGLSGLYVHNNFRGKRLSIVLLQSGMALAEQVKATGIYADFDYRNYKSMKVVSKYMSFLGYTDGRNGNIDEATIYTTFYKHYGPTISKPAVVLQFDKQSCDNARQKIDTLLKNIGPYTLHTVSYCGGYNEIACLDYPYTFEDSHVIISEEITNFSKNEEETLDKN